MSFLLHGLLPTLYILSCTTLHDLTPFARFCPASSPIFWRLRRGVMRGKEPGKEMTKQFE